MKCGNNELTLSSRQAFRGKRVWESNISETEDEKTKIRVSLQFAQPSKLITFGNHREYLLRFAYIQWVCASVIQLLIFQPLRLGISRIRADFYHKSVDLLEVREQDTYVLITYICSTLLLRPGLLTSKYPREIPDKYQLVPGLQYRTLDSYTSKRSISERALRLFYRALFSGLDSTPNMFLVVKTL